jgi:hypothetical protein
VGLGKSKRLEDDDDEEEEPDSLESHISKLESEMGV